MTGNDIQFFHSGGTMNNDPELDLGGVISAFQLSAISLNNLFDTLTPGESIIGRVDYRCFYIVNNNITDILRNVKLWVRSQVVSGSYIQIGVHQNNEVQQIEVSGTPNEGETLVLSINSTNFTTTFSPNLSVWKEDFQNQIRSVNGLNDVIVEITGNIPNIFFTVTFLGQAANRKYNLFNVITNNLTGTTINITELTSGSPINEVASTIATKYYAPNNVNFGLVGLGNPIRLGNLNPLDKFAVWAKRVTPENTFKKTNDNFILELSGGGI